MIAPATLYGLIRYRSIWYAPNLLAAMGDSGLGREEHGISGFISFAGAAGGRSGPCSCLGFGWNFSMEPYFPFSQETNPHCGIFRANIGPVFVWHAGGSESDTEPEDRLGMVHPFADCLRPGSGLRCESACSGSHSSVPVAAIFDAGRNYVAGNRTR